MDKKNKIKKDKDTIEIPLMGLVDNKIKVIDGYLIIDISDREKS